MKLFIVCLLIFIRLLSSAQTVNIELKKASLTQLLNTLSQDYKTKFAFDNSLTDNQIVSIKMHQVSIEEILQKTLPKYGLNFRKLGDVYIIQKIVRNEITIEPIQAKTDKNNYIKGVVKAVGSNEKLPYAVLSTQGKNKKESNQEGYFVIPNIEKDSTIIEVKMIGYKTAYVKLSNDSLQSKFFEIYLEKLNNNLTFSDEKSSVINISGSYGQIKFDTEKLQQFSTIVQGDMSAPLQCLPGIEGTSEITAGIGIRKSKADKTLVTLDGFTLYQNDHFFGLFSSVNSNALKDVQMYKSGISAKYGGRVSGVVEMIGKSGNYEKFSGNIGVDLLCTDIQLEIPIWKKGSLVLSGRNSYGGIYKSPLYYSLLNNVQTNIDQSSRNNRVMVFSQDIGIEPDYHFSDYNLRFTYSPTYRDMLFLSVYKGNDAFDFQDFRPEINVLENSDWGNKALGLKWARQWNGRYFSNILLNKSIYQSDYAHIDSSDINRPIKPNRHDLSVYNQLSDANLHLNNDLVFNTHHKFSFGIFISKCKIDYLVTDSRRNKIYNTKDTIRQNNSDAGVLGGYLEYVFNKNKIKTLSFGVRTSKVPQIKQVLIEPRISFKYLIVDEILLKASYDKQHQFINKIPIVDISFRDVWLISNNSNIPVVESDHISLGFVANLGNWTIDIEAYNKQQTGLSLMVKDTIRTIDLQVNAIDLMLKYQYKNYSSWIAYTIGKSCYQETKMNKGEAFSTNDDQLHEIKWINFLQTGNWNFNLIFVIGSGKKWDNFSLDILQNPQLLSSYEMYSETLPIYHRLDAKAEYTHKLKQSKLTAGLSIFNLYNQQNIIYRFNKYLTTRTDLYGLGFTPNVYFNFSF